MKPTGVSPSIVVTTVTPTGAQRARALLKDSVHYSYLLYDLPGAVVCFLDCTQPRVALSSALDIRPTRYNAPGRLCCLTVISSAPQLVTFLAL